MAEDSKGTNYARLALGAGLLAAAAVSVAVFVPRKRLTVAIQPVGSSGKTGFVPNISDAPVPQREQVLGRE